MKNLKFSLQIFFLLFVVRAYAQTTDTTLVSNSFIRAETFEKAKQPDSAAFYYYKTKQLLLSLPESYNFWSIDKNLACLSKLAKIYLIKKNYDKSLIISDSVILISNQAYGDSSLYASLAYFNKGSVYYYSSQPDKCLENWIICLAIRKKLYGINHVSVAMSYNNIGAVYFNKAEYNKALEYYYKSLYIKKVLLGENNIEITSMYNNIGNVYSVKAEYDKALSYYFKSLDIRKQKLGEKHTEIASSYNNIGNIYFNKSEYDKALEYYFNSLNIRKELFGENNPDVAMSYNNIGNVFWEKAQYNKALDYHNKSLEIRKELFGEDNPDVAASYNNIAAIYEATKNYDKSLDYYFESLKIKKEIFGDNHIDIATTYSNIGNVYEDNKNYDKALEYYFKSLYMRKNFLGKKHIDITGSYNNIGFVYYNLKQYNLALKYYHLGILASLPDCNDTLNINNLPTIKNYLGYKDLIQCLQGKAKCFIELAYKESNKSTIFQNALKYYQSADTLIISARKNSSKQSDKIALGETASHIYENAINICLKLIGCEDLSNNLHNYYYNLAFYFSEQNKSVVLLEAISSQEGLKFAGIPDSLLQKEQNLKSEINFYEKNLAEGVDSAEEIIIRDKLFYLNLNYEELIKSFEKNYPDYFNLKYSAKQPSIADIQAKLDKKTALRSYFIGDSIIYIFTLTSKIIDIQQITKTSNLEDTIELFRKSLIFQSNERKKDYCRIGNSLFKQLFPDYEKILKYKNLLVIPDGALGVIPFEALLTDYPEITTNEGLNKYNNYPFLIKKFNISYSYSANLFYRTFPKHNSTKPEITNLNDWLAFAPVFDDKNNKGVMLASRELQRQLTLFKPDSFVTRRFLLNGGFVLPLPGTESETKAIFDEYQINNKKAQVLLNQNANEQYIKSGALNNYKTIHFATHGFVNSEKPELSGILLAQDTTEKEDGFLYSGEIYNLKLNADLVVLSACETGLGQIKKGEGIIGLTRALLYAGAKNIVVSLWQVSDESTSELMINFYKNKLSEKSNGYSIPLRQAKLKMINENKFAHPFYWSPFVLIGK